MITFWDHIAPADVNKAKRSLLIVATGTLLISTIEFQSNQLSFLDLSLSVSKQKTVKLGQAITALLLFVFLLKDFPTYLSSQKKTALSRLEELHATESSSFMDNIGAYSLDEGSLQAEVESFKAEQLKNKQYLERRYDRNISIANRLSFFLIDRFVPIGLASLVLFDPYLLADWVSSPCKELFEFSPCNERTPTNP
ncbi:MAG TPA: hypothetical protein DC031_20370 [Sulfitobacter sp.]|uniref:hypothetical protein n=1 Tax=Sulfitobacter dubius TaxID=218673 RepID=UPI000E981B66|nr:hypothetical protein [Sulfitobacter sp.]|tara:strand:+ start:85 stop:672 length:588 start_codon:yes stop_codon:yes gene_type:complete